MFYLCCSFAGGRTDVTKGLRHSGNKRRTGTGRDVLCMLHTPNAVALVDFPPLALIQMFARKWLISIVSWPHLCLCYFLRCIFYTVL